MILSKAFKSDKVTKNPLMKSEYRGYQNGQKKPTGLPIMIHGLNKYLH